ncbi:hypothetical protein DL96DRAFT_1706128 [Flagelloscypha sp. PMI_526]|nr:hypothetical protein DL96DRAFT_1706128 [Flagelloscypha sp. PMI_526]
MNRRNHELRREVPVLPLDIAQYIFELVAAANSKAQCSILSLVSKEIQIWADPYLFKSITNTRHPFFERLISEAPLSSCPRLDRRCSLVKYFSAEHQHYEDIQWAMNVMTIFPNLISFHGGYSELKRNNLLSAHPTLRRIGCLGPLVTDVDFSCAFFQNITHLNLSAVHSTSWSSLAERNLESLKSLMYLRLHAENPLILKRQRQDLAGAIPSSVHVVLVELSQYFSAYQSRFMLEEFSRMCYCCEGEMDDRVVFMCHQPMPGPQWIIGVSSSVFWDADEWTGRIPEEETFWEQGLAIVNARRASLA